MKPMKPTRPRLAGRRQLIWHVAAGVALVPGPQLRLHQGLRSAGLYWTHGTGSPFGFPKTTHQKNTAALSFICCLETSTRVFRRKGAQKHAKRLEKAFGEVPKLGFCLKISGFVSFGAGDTWMNPHLGTTSPLHMTLGDPSSKCSWMRKAHEAMGSRCVRVPIRKLATFVRVVVCVCGILLDASTGSTGK